MACRGVLFAITQEEAQRLRAARGNDASVLSIVQDEIEEAWDEAHLCETDKAWDAIHRCLGDGTLASGKDPHSLCILGGEPLHAGDSYIIRLLTPERVKQVVTALRPVDKAWLRERYFKIDPADYALPGQLCEEDFETHGHTSKTFASSTRRRPLTIAGRFLLWISNRFSHSRHGASPPAPLWAFGRAEEFFFLSYPALTPRRARRALRRRTGLVSFVAVATGR